VPVATGLEGDTSAFSGHLAMFGAPNVPSAARAVDLTF